MRRLADTGYRIYAACAVGSLLLAGLALFGPGARPGSLELSLGSTHLALLAMAVTLAFGLLVVLPSFRRTQDERIQLTHRTAQLEKDVVTDPLTGLYNRRYFQDALKEYHAEFAAIGAPLALLTLDLDHFKSVNDTYGHDAGDVVLRQLANRLKRLTREHDVVARTGGEEFCILAPFSRGDQIRPFAERVCRMVGEMRVDVGAVILRPTISVGVASTLEGNTTPASLMKVADQRLYRAKESGRDRVCA